MFPGIKQWFNNGFKTKEQVQIEHEERFASENEERLERGEKALKWKDLYDKDEKKEAKA